MTVSDTSVRALVRQMRAAQKRYFKDRRSDDLEESKRLEREVDKAIDEQGQHSLYHPG